MTCISRRTQLQAGVNSSSHPPPVWCPHPQTLVSTLQGPEAHQACRQASETAAAWDWPGPEEWHVCSTLLFCLPLWAPQCHDGPKWPPQHKQMDNYLRQGRKSHFKATACKETSSINSFPHHRHKTWSKDCTWHTGETCSIAEGRLDGCTVPALAQSAKNSVKCGT